MNSDDRSLERAARSWLEVGPTEAPARVVEAALLRIETTPQERDLRIPWRFPTMSTPARVVAAAVIGVLAVGGAFFVLRPGGSSVGGPGPTPAPTASPTPTPGPAALRNAVLPAGTYVTTPFAPPTDLGLCIPQQPGCTEPASDDTIRFTFSVPNGWEGGTIPVVWSTYGDGVGLVFERGGSLYSHPCGDEPPPNIAVGPTVDDFVSALVDHPLLDVSTPVDVTLGGFSGKYLDLQVPSDISACPTSYLPWEPGLYAQGPSHRWHLWILDVDGIRVVVQSMDYAATSAQRRAELQAIVDSIQIEP